MLKLLAKCIYFQWTIFDFSPAMWVWGQNSWLNSSTGSVFGNTPCWPIFARSTFLDSCDNNVLKVTTCYVISTWQRQYSIKIHLVLLVGKFSSSKFRQCFLWALGSLGSWTLTMSLSYMLDVFNMHQKSIFIVRG